MNETIKSLVRQGLNRLHLDWTKNLKYDRLTKVIISKTVKTDTVCVDIGAHKGEILDLFIQKAHHQKHFAFEPIPDLYHQLILKYADTCNVFPYALGDAEGETTFQYVRNAPAYSGIKKRSYEIKHPDIKELMVQLKTLDSMIPTDIKVGFIKIDVEGAEFSVLKGALNILKRDHPFVIFECGLGASDYYGTTPEEVFDFFKNETTLKISLLNDWIKGKKPLTRQQFCECYQTNAEYYFLAHLIDIDK
jgi:FkbM family methyltransferase